jgi:hypothetical protein
VARVIETMLGKRTLLVVSTDLSHYLDYASAERHDLATAGTIERLDYTTLGPNDACGFSALNGALCTASRCGWTVHAPRFAQFWRYERREAAGGGLRCLGLHGRGGTRTSIRPSTPLESTRLGTCARGIPIIRPASRLQLGAGGT